MPALWLAARAVGARRHVPAGRGVTRGPRAIRALRARARWRPRAFAGARRGRDDPRHHHAPVLEHGRKATGCAPFERKHLGRCGPGESLEAIQPGLAEQGIITRTGPLCGRAYLTEQRTTSHGGTRSSPCFTRFLLLAIRNRLVDKLVECCTLLGGADGSHDWIPYDVAVLVDNVGGREREQV